MAENSKDLVTINHLPGLLLASAAECERWIADGLIPVADRKTFRKSGRILEARLFDPETVARLVADVPVWRAKDEAEAQGRRGDAPRQATHARSAASPDGSRPDGSLATPVDEVAHRRRQSLLAHIRASTGIYIGEDVRKVDDPGQSRRKGRHGRAQKPGREFLGYRAAFSKPIQLLPGEAPTVVVIEYAFAEPPEVAETVLSARRADRADMAAAEQALETTLLDLRDAVFDACAAEAVSWQDELETYLAAYEDEEERSAVFGAVKAAVDRLDRIQVSDRHGPEGAGRKLYQKLGHLRSNAAAKRLRHLREVQIRDASGYERYATIFPVARSLGRKFLFLAGPTNSGKTHEALRLAGAADTAEILSPLRLLALEHYERLNDGGLAAGMVTGEERAVPEGATHIARTIETLDLRRVVDVCVIDEVQMLGDPSRGWAWTQAIVGAPARLVVLTGAPEAIPMVEHLLAMTGEPLEIKVLKRKGPLSVEDAPVDLNKLSRGDAVIAFSRKNIHELRNRLVHAGRTVATVYGALGPEVRRAEAARFRNGEAEILVATDAIGMGLNIGPLRRVVFSTFYKFDGVRDRQLNAMEVKQIAGRAGRFGHHNEGLVTALSEAGRYPEIASMISRALAGESTKLRGKAYVRPNQETVLSASEVLNTDRLSPVLRHLNDTLVSGHPDLQMADMEEMIELARLLDTVDLPLNDRLSYSMAPVDGREGMAVDLLIDWARQHARHGRVVPPNFGVSADLVKLEARAKIATTWLWLSQRYPDIYDDAATVVELRAGLNATIEEKLIATSTARRRRSAAKPTRGQKNRRKSSRRRDHLEAAQFTT